ncbi:MAG: hypothetical protein EWM47_00185 [Anaerolineaceae bacterium]|nr:MAG: hypothetical protein EWM47_00185 [Anaerolineaceae bacterium]
MLGKLIKHEINATGRIFLPLYLIIILLSLVNRVLTNVDIFNGPLNTIRVFMIAAYALSIIATLVVTFVIMILRFYKNLMSDEGYLMFTLPVKSSQLINAKLVVSTLWNIISIIIVGASLLMIFGTSNNLQMLREFIDFGLMSLKANFGNKYVLLIVEFIFMMLVSLIQQIMLIYVSIAVGHLFNGHKVLGSFASYIGISTIMQLIITLVLVVWAFMAGSSFEELEAIPQLVFPFSIIIASVFNVLFYLVTNYIFKRKLNLE